MVAGVWLLASHSGVGLVIIDVLLVLAGLNLIVAAALGNRSLYLRRYDPRSHEGTMNGHGNITNLGPCRVWLLGFCGTTV